MIVGISTSVALEGGTSCGCAKARRIADRKLMGCTSRVEGYDAVKTGSKMTAK